MNAFLMHRDRDFDLERPLPDNEEELTQDLELTTLFDAMARGDGFLFEVARRAVLSSLTDPEAIAYRQHVLADCLQEPSVVQGIYAIAVEAIERERRVWHGLMSSPDAILRRSVEVLGIFLGLLRRLRSLSDAHAERFRSEGFSRFFAMLSSELDDGYLGSVERHLEELRFRRGVLMSAQLGRGNKGVGYVVRRAPEPTWRERFFGRRGPAYSFQIADRDESGFRALAELRGRGIDLVADAVARSADHILGFFRMVRAELAFYIGCLNLHQLLTEKGEPVCFPTPLPPGRPALAARGLYDVCLSLRLEGRAVGNDIEADDRRLVMITGANQGGKSTFLRSVGLAQLMMQCGMFVGAEWFRADVRDGIFTHFKREEDPGMRSGKLDEELDRMSRIVDAIGPNGILLCNESFASTNEREGSEIARQVVEALTDVGVKVLFVTHLFDLAHGLHARSIDTALFLRAERLPDGTRTFRLVEGEPLPTSHGRDSYRRVFGIDARPAVATTDPRT